MTQLENVFSIDQDLLAEAEVKHVNRLRTRRAFHEGAIESILKLADKPGTHVSPKYCHRTYLHIFLLSGAMFLLPQDSLVIFAGVTRRHLRI
jgi:hypothetical protein